MAQTYETYVSDGSTTIYTFNFDYLKQSFVKVRVEGTEVGFTLSGTYQVTLDAAPTAGQVIVISRETDTDRLVDFVDGSVLIAKDLNTSALQATHIAAEALDKAAGSLLINEAGHYTAGFRKITEVGDPTDARDVVNKQWAETAMTSQLAQATAAKTAAETAETAAETAKTASEAARDAAQSSQTAAAASETNAGGSASTAATSATNASNSASAAATSAANAANSEAKAQDWAEEAEDVEVETGQYSAKHHATKAAASAAAAATFDPANYVAKSGDTLTGGLTVSANIPFHALTETDAPVGYQQYRIILANGVVQHQTLTDTGAWVATDYAVARDNSGATEHKFNISGNYALKINSSAFEVARGPVFKMGNVNVNVAGTTTCGLTTDTSNGITDVQVTSNFPDTTRAFAVYQGSTQRFKVNGNGNCANSNNVYGSLSDVRLKENIADVGSQLEDLKALRVVNYNMIGDETKQVGLIAQEVQKVKPGLVEGPNEDGYLGVKYSVLVPLLLKGMQEQQAQIEALEARLVTLENTK